MLCQVNKKLVNTNAAPTDNEAVGQIPCSGRIYATKCDKSINPPETDRSHCYTPQAGEKPIPDYP